MICPSLIVAEQVQIWQGTLTLPTYEEGPPDPNPPFDQFSGTRFDYPYPLRTNLTNRRVNHEWRAIFLENEYLKCSVLPDLGGHVYTCIDKINGQPMFYANPSIKKANIGYRGAWAAFGIEFNFPVSHNWMSLSPVDFAFAQHADGSASVTVGNIERVYGMQWSVELILRPGSTVLEQRVTLANRSDVRHRFYWWNNGGVQVWDDSQIEYPMRFAARHGFTEVVAWPIDAHGHDLSIIHNQADGPVSLFVHGSREPFMGVWHPHTRSGTVHFASYDELPGKKIWSWGENANARNWRRALSDDDSAYVEVQAGLFRNQETYAFLEPRQSIHFSEYWMPLRDIGGITRANLAGVLHLKRTATSWLIGFNANQPIPGAGITVSAGQQRLLRIHADLVPERSWSREERALDPQQKCTVEIRDHRGSLLMRHTEGEYDWTPESEITVGPQANYKIPAAESRTEDDWLQLGEKQELDGKLLQALETYAQLLHRFPASYSALKAAGRLSVALLHFEDAVRFLEPVSNRNTTNAAASYYLGIAYDGLGFKEKSRQAFLVPYRSPPWRAAAALRLGEMSARENQLSQAERYLRDAQRIHPDDLRASEELVAVERALGKEQEAQILARRQLRQFPLSYFLENELGRPNLQQLANDHSRILNIADEYMRLGLYQSAVELLSRAYPPPLPDQSEPSRSAVARDPMIAYYRGYCREKLGQSGAADYATASRLPTAYIFPSSATDGSVLRAAEQANATDATAQYLLGTLYFSRGVDEQALREWNKARAVNPRIRVLDASLGRALLGSSHDAEGALAAFQEGIHNDPGNEAVYLGADQSLSILKRPVSDRVHALELYADSGGMSSSLLFELALNLSEAGAFERATALFHQHFFPREEGGLDVRQVWVEVKLDEALRSAEAGQCPQALSLVKNLTSPVRDLSFTNNGLEAFVNSARSDYLLGQLELGCGNREESQRRFQAAATHLSAGEVVWASLAAKQLSGFDQNQWTERLQAALDEANVQAEASSWWAYSAGMLNRALGREPEAEAKFQEALSLPDQFLAYHLTREALAQR